jgi:hypothetical protein
MPEISGYIGSTQGVKAMPIPISNAHSAEKGSWAVGCGFSCGSQWLALAQGPPRTGRHFT